MPWWIAVRDHDAGKPVSVTDANPKTMESAYATARKQYPPPRFEVVLGMAGNLDAFLKAYPRFQGAKSAA
jgi:hypothetical protein